MKDEEIHFYLSGPYVLDTFSAHAIELWGLLFPTAEHAFQWKKFSNTAKDVAEQILQTKSPLAAKTLARVNKLNADPKWVDKKSSIMEEILRAKASQHEDVKDFLVNTGSKTLIEDSPDDDFWGAGPNGGGRNELGKIWMRLREELKQGTTAK